VAAAQFVGKVRRSATGLDRHSPWPPVPRSDPRHDRRVILDRPVQNHPARLIQHANLHAFLVVIQPDISCYNRHGSSPPKKDYGLTKLDSNPTRGGELSSPSVQLVKEVKRPIPATKSHPQRIDYEYERAGVANVFMSAEPLAGWRNVSIRESKTKIDWAEEMAHLLEGRYAECEKVIVVCDNLNTHTKGAFYEAFEAERAFALASRVEFHYTPKHGSWLNIAENELSSMTRQCVSNRRIGDIETLQRETSAWAKDVSIQQRTVDWQMRLDDARCKLKSVYPKI
jgi:hypothetical protein